MFCMQRLNDGSEIEALLCCHSFHRECVDRFLEVTGKRREEACPMKCHQSNMLQVIEEEQAPEGEQPAVDEEMEGSVSLSD